MTDDTQRPDERVDVPPQFSHTDWEDLQDRIESDHFPDAVDAVTDIPLCGTCEQPWPCLEVRTLEYIKYLRRAEWKLTLLTEVLEWYADYENWTAEPGEPNSVAEQDEGRRAQRALNFAEERGQ